MSCSIGKDRSVDISGLDHFAIHVADLESSARWYQEVFGLRILHKWTTTWMVGRGSVKVGLFLRADAKPVAEPDKTLVIQHVAFLVDGDKFDGVRDQLLAKGIAVHGPEDSGIAYSIFFNDPDGHLLEITTYHPVQSTAPPNA